MEVLGTIRRGWGYEMIVEDMDSKKIGQMLWDKRFLPVMIEAFKNSDTTRKGKVIIKMTYTDKGISIDFQPKTEQKEVIKKGKGRPAGAKNKKTLRKEANETLSQVV